MPSSRSLDFSEDAVGDIRELLAYSLLSWGPDRHAAYAAALDQAFERLASYPALGRARDDLLPGCRQLRVREHAVFYKVDADVVRVLRVLHGRMDPRHGLGR